MVPISLSQAVMAREYQKGGIYTRENLLIFGFDGSSFRATPVFRGCRNFATAKPGRYHPYSGTLVSEPGLGSPLSLRHRCGSFLAQVKTHFALDTSLPADRISRVLLWGREEFLPDLTAAAGELETLARRRRDDPQLQPALTAALAILLERGAAASA